MESQKKPDTTVESKPVAFDKSIYKTPDCYVLVIKEDDQEFRIEKKTLQEAQRAANLLRFDGGI